MVISYITRGNVGIYFHDADGNHHLWDGFTREVQFISKHRPLTWVAARPQYWNNQYVVVNRDCQSYRVIRIPPHVAINFRFDRTFRDVKVLAWCVVGNVLYVLAYYQFFKRNLCDASKVAVTFLQSSMVARQEYHLFPIDNGLVLFGRDFQPNQSSRIEYFSLSTETWSLVSLDIRSVEHLTPTLVHL